MTYGLIKTVFEAVARNWPLLKYKHEAKDDKLL